MRKPERGSGGDLPNARRLGEIFRRASIGIGIVDADGRTIHTNDALRRLLGYSPEELAELHFDAYTHPDDVARNAELFAELIAGERESFEFEKRFYAKDGSLVWGRLTVSLIREEPTGLLAIGMLEDITERVRLQTRLAAAEETYRQLVEQVPAVVYCARADRLGPWEYVSPQIGRLLGDSPEQWLASPDLFHQRLHPDDRDRVLAGVRDLVHEGRPATLSRQYRLLRRDGRAIWVRDDTVFEVDRSGPPLLRGVWTDITREKELEARLEYQAFHDSLTGLANRELFIDRVAHRLRQREPEDRAGTLLFIDLDGFKAVNDRFGHARGDALLGAVADRLRDAVRPGDTAARLGGDEFAVLLEAIHDPEVMAGVARRLHAALEQPYDLQGSPIEVGASIGMVDLQDAEDAESALQLADAAMYRAKARGRGRVARHATRADP